MKITKTEGIFLAAAVLFVVFASGYFLGRHSIAGSFIVETQKMPVGEAETPVAPFSGTEAAEATSAPAREASGPAQPATAAGTEKININTADAALLDTLPGIGEKRAQDIISYREQNGLFRYVEQIVEVPGIGEGILNDIADLITVGEEGAS